MFHAKITLAASLVLTTILVAQSRSATYEAGAGNSQVSCSVELRGYSTRSTGTNDYSLTQAFNDAEFAIGGANQNGIEVQSLSYATRNADGSYYTTNWNGIYRGGNQVMSQYFGNGTLKVSVGAGTVVDQARTFAVGPYTVGATIRVSAGASIDQRHRAYANFYGRSAELSGTTRTFLDGTVWGVAGMFGATASMVSTLDMVDTTVHNYYQARPGFVSGVMTYARKQVRLYMFAMARRYWWQSYTTRTIVNSLLSAVNGSQNLN